MSRGRNFIAFQRSGGSTYDSKPTNNPNSYRQRGAAPAPGRGLDSISRGTMASRRPQAAAKRKTGGWFDEDDDGLEDDEPSGPPGPGAFDDDYDPVPPGPPGGRGGASAGSSSSSAAAADDDYDPLEAFMAGVNETVKEQKKTEGVEKQKAAFLDEDQPDVVDSYMEAKQKEAERLARGEDEEVEYGSDGLPVEREDEDEDGVEYDSDGQVRNKTAGPALALPLTATLTPQL